MDRGAWQATVHKVAKSWTRLSNLAHTHVEVQIETAHHLGKGPADYHSGHVKSLCKITFSEAYPRAFKLRFVYCNSILLPLATHTLVSWYCKLFLCLHSVYSF